MTDRVAPTGHHREYAKSQARSSSTKATDDADDSDNQQAHTKWRFIATRASSRVIGVIGGFRRPSASDDPRWRSAPPPTSVGACPKSTSSATRADRGSRYRAPA